MAKKTDLRRSKNTDLPRYVTKTARGFYLYQRRVPKGLAEELTKLGTSPEMLADLIPAKGLWVHSLGSDPAEMAEQARYWTEHYDGLIAPATSFAPIPPDPKRAAQRGIIKAAIQTADAVPEQRWKLAGAVMDQARPHGPDMERDALTLFKAQAFGGEAAADSLSIPVRVGPDGVLLIGDVTASAVEALPVPRPAGGDGFMFDASRAAVEARQKEVAPNDSSHPLRISQLMAPMATDRGHRQGTADGLRRKVDRFTKFAGDKPLWEYDFETIIAYRDRLRAGDADYGPVKESVVNQYIRALKMVWNYAPERWKEYRDTTFPNVKLRKIKEDLQDTRWKAFTDDQMKALHEVMQREWGTNAETRLTPSRRKAFLIAIQVMLWTGLRPVEVFHLTKENIVGDTIEIRYTKTGNRRTLPLCKHLSDLPAFLAAGGFKAELEAAENDTYGGEVRGKTTSPASLAKSMRRYFAEIREKAGITDPKQVLYSCKDTLVRRLQLIFRQKGIPISHDDIRDIIGHKTKGALAHYLTPLGGLDEGIELIREALDAIEYW